MQQFLNLALSGLVTGAIYSIMASGLILTYTTSGIFNFAHGAIAYTTAYVYYQVHTGLGLPIVPAVAVSVLVFAPLLGLLLDRVLLRRLATAPVHARIVGTIGLLVVLPNLAQWLVITVGIDVLGLDGLLDNDAINDGTPVAGLGPTPARFYQPVHGVALSSDQLAVFAAAGITAVLLWYVIRRTRIGLEMRAVVDRESLAGLRGIDAARTSAIAWVLTMLLAGLGGVLIAPLFTLSDGAYTLVVLGSLAVVVLGGLRSIPLAFAGGLALGVVQNLVAGYSEDVLPEWLSELNGLKSSVPFLLVIVLLLGFGRDRSRRAGTVADDVPRPDHRRGLSATRRRLPWAVATVALLAYSLQWSGVSWLRADHYFQTVIAQGLAMAVIFLSFVLVTGMGGMVSLGQATFVTVGGFAAGWALTRDWGVDVPGLADEGHLNFLWIVAIGGIAAALFGVLLALPLTRLGGVSFALGTLAFAFVCSLVVFSIDSVRHGQSGWTIRQPSVDLPGLSWVYDALVPESQPRFDAGTVTGQILLFLAVFGVVTASIHALQRSASGRAILAVRSSEVAAAASGVRVDRIKVLLFGLSAGIAGIGGVLLGLFSYTVSDATAPPLAGLAWLAIAVTFGVRRPGGALIAGLASSCAAAVFEALGGRFSGGALDEMLTSVYFVAILSGIGAIQLAQEPDGVLALAGQRRLAKQRERRRTSIESAGAVRTRAVDRPPDAVEGGADRSDEAPFAMTGIVAGYGDVEVLHGVDLRLPAGEVVALLGANGAGKSTLCAVAAGIVEPTAGRVSFRGHDITDAPSFERTRQGVLLVPEARGVFPGLTVEENLAVLLRDEAHREQALLRFPVLAQRRRQIAGLLSGGEQQMLSLAPALVDPPAVLLADEPTLGLAPLAAAVVLDAIEELRALGCAVLLVEEHSHHALQVADTVVCMERGRVVWTGPRGEANLDLVAGAYLGSATTRQVPTRTP